MGRITKNKKDKGNKLKRKTKDLDQIQEDMKPVNSHKLLNQEVDYDVVGNAQNYCLHCAKHFISLDAMKGHFLSKPHKRRLKSLETEAYSVEESERASGLGSYRPAKKLAKVHTQDVPENMDDTDIK